jgi:site-specific DNA-methyltransferase (adenine-specific)
MPHAPSQPTATPPAAASAKAPKTQAKERVRTAKAHAASKLAPARKPSKKGDSTVGHGSTLKISAQHAGPDGPAKPEAQIRVGDCRTVLATLKAELSNTVDLIFADPPFNWNVPYDQWHDGMEREDYLQFTYDWLDGCHALLRPTGALWVNIPDDTAAEIVVHLKRRGLHMVNWCIWHYRFGQNNRSRFINSKVHALYFAGCEHVRDARDPREAGRTWNPLEIVELSDRASIYGDKRTLSKKDGMPAGKRVPMDVWYGQYWGRIQGNNKERRAHHHNQLPEIYLERVIRACSQPGDLVLDPFTGSGTTGVVARHLNRRFIGIEYSLQNARSAADRIEDGMIPREPTAESSSAIFKKRRALDVPG